MRTNDNEVGFTLVEILVVVVIVGIVLSTVLLSFNLLRDDREMRTEAQRLGALLEVTQDEAAMQGREYGVELLNNGYRFVEFDAFTSLWSEVPNDETLRLRSLPEGVEFELYLEDQRVLLNNDPALFEDPDKLTGRRGTVVYSPHLLVYSSGESTPFELHLWRSLDQRRMILTGDAFGEMKISTEEEN